MGTESGLGHNWPQDADGDVLRRLGKSGFDFSQPCVIDFNVDFAVWPPSEEAVAWLLEHYPDATAYPPDSDSTGYYHFQIFATLTYDLVIGVQRKVTSALQKFGGVCESWGVLH